MRIGELAEAAGVPTSTVRYYERAGLLPEPERTESNYRVYGPDALERLRFIRNAQASGFTLVDIATLFEFRAGTQNDRCGEVQHLIEGRLEALDEHLADLKQFHLTLRELLQQCRDTESGDDCATLEQIESSSSRS